MTYHANFGSGWLAYFYRLDASGYIGEASVSVDADELVFTGTRSRYLSSNRFRAWHFVVWFVGFLLLAWILPTRTEPAIQITWFLMFLASPLLLIPRLTSRESMVIEKSSINAVKRRARRFTFKGLLPGAEKLQTISFKLDTADNASRLEEQLVT